MRSSLACLGLFAALCGGPYRQPRMRPPLSYARSIPTTSLCSASNTSASRSTNGCINSSARPNLPIALTTLWWSWRGHSFRAGPAGVAQRDRNGWPVVSRLGVVLSGCTRGQPEAPGQASNADRIRGPLWRLGHNQEPGGLGSVCGASRFVVRAGGKEGSSPQEAPRPVDHGREPFSAQARSGARPAANRRARASRGWSPHLLHCLATNATGGYDERDKRFDAWPLPAIVDLRGNWVGDLPAEPVLTGGTGFDKLAGMKLRDEADALLQVSGLGHDTAK